MAGENPVVLKSGSCFLSVSSLWGPGKLSAKEKSISTAVRHSATTTMCGAAAGSQSPTLQDFHAELLRQPEAEAQDVALALELFTEGSLNTFASPPMWTQAPASPVMTSGSWANSCSPWACW